LELTLKIEKMVHGGAGLCRTGNGVVFVSGALPGETVRATVERSASGRTHAAVAEILESSLSRRKPACALAGTCGGCDWLHVRYKAQTAMKAEIFRECLVRIGKIGEVPVVETVESPEFGYRQRVQFKLDRVARTAGFFGKKSNTVVPVSRCAVLCDRLNELLSALPSRMLELPQNLFQVKAICGSPPTAANSEAQPLEIASHPVLPGITVPSTIIETGPHRFVVDGNSFFQANRFLSGAMGQWAAQNLRGETLWDLFGGGGFFSVFLGKQFTNGVLVESEPAHAAAARRNLAENGIASMRVEPRTVAGFLRDAKKAGRRADCTVVDPPREGLQKDVRELLAAIAPAALLYVSCDPATQARDTGSLMKSCGYRIEKAAMFDCYPQTHHLETMLLLKR
jgi:23S rRNA (uracil1939-C5)-methyltransferase